MTISKVYCAAPFVSRSSSPDGRSKPCCEWDSAINEDSDISLQDLREAMLRGDPTDGCRSCYQTEEAGVVSTRMHFNSVYGYTTDVVLRHLDFSLGNLCNFKCRMCNGISSSKWSADLIAMGLPGRPLYRRKATELESCDLSNLDMIKFKGGETLFEQETMVEVLSMVKDQLGDLSNLVVQFNTNGSQEITDELFSLLSSCGQVHMTVSVDAVGKINDYQRTGSVWSVLENNLRRWSVSIPNNFKLSIYSVWSLLNIHGAIELIEWANDVIPRYTHHGTTLTTPNALGIRNIPDQIKKVYRDEIFSWNKLDHIFEADEHKKMIIGELDRSPNLAPSAVLDHIKVLDKLRRESFEDINPELYRALSENSNHSKLALSCDFATKGNVHGH